MPPNPHRTTAALSGLRHLRALNLSLCYALDDGGLAALAACPSLAELDVRGAWRLSDTGAAAAPPPGARRAEAAEAAAAAASSLTHWSLRQQKRRRPARTGSARDWGPPSLTAPPALPFCSGVRHLLASSTSLVSLNVEGCHRLFGSSACAPEGFELRGPGARRPGVIARRPPGAGGAAAALGGSGAAAAGGCEAVDGSSPEASPRAGEGAPEVEPVAA
jgi:hypothetical protein